MTLRAAARSSSTTSPSAAMCARWPARCAATAISCCRARAIRSGCRPARAPTATARGFISISIPASARLSADLDGVLSFEARAPRFEGAVTLAAPAAPKAKRRRQRCADAVADHRPRSRPIRPRRSSNSSRPATARKTRALKFVGRRRHSASAPRRCCMRCCRRGNSMPTSSPAKDNDKDNTAAEPMRLLPALRALIAAIPQPPIPTQIEFSSEQIMLGGRPLQNFAADLHADAKSWTIDRLDFRAPGTTRVSLSGSNAQPGPSGSFQGRAQCRVLRSGYAGGVAAGPQRGDLSQPEAAAPARRCQRRRRTASPSTP